jgi:hypothetical protein
MSSLEAPDPRADDAIVGAAACGDAAGATADAAKIRITALDDEISVLLTTPTVTSA